MRALKRDSTKPKRKDIVKTDGGVLSFWWVTTTKATKRRLLLFKKKKKTETEKESDTDAPSARSIKLNLIYLFCFF